MTTLGVVSCLAVVVVASDAESLAAIAAIGTIVSTGLQLLDRHLRRAAADRDAG